MARRQSVFSADALAWALHAAGRDAEALPLVERAGALGRRDADGGLPPRDDPGRARPHRRGAPAALERALATNPHFSPLHARTARQTLDALRGRP